ncbi:MAG: HAMP domain-containing histidine kinase, partial [Deltaproteobacteria bacterium]|nr:HAMP domain-containing histidine kinase [Deltaproteobacteria bacterium]
VDGRKLPILSILADHLAIALSHARLFTGLKEANRRLEERVRERTRKLAEANRDLQAAQAEVAHKNEELQERVARRTAQVENALQELRVQHASLEEANRIKDEFLNNINHELKTPLNAVIGYAGLLLKETRDVLQDEQRADLELIEANGRHLQQILESILSLKDIENGTVELDRRPADLNELLQSAVSSVRPRAQVKSLEMTFEPLDVPPVWIDSTLILRVVYNLLDNAVKFSSRGRITVRSRVSQGGPGEPEELSDDSYAVVDVEDQGLGVRPEDVVRIFNKFQQAEAPTRKHEAGSGIGLTIAKNLVELHGGRIWVRSGPGPGATFSFSLPLRA